MLFPTKCPACFSDLTEPDHVYIDHIRDEVLYSNTQLGTLSVEQFVDQLDSDGYIIDHNNVLKTSKFVVAGCNKCRFHLPHLSCSENS